MNQTYCPSLFYLSISGTLLNDLLYYQAIHAIAWLKTTQASKVIAISVLF